MHRHRGEQSRRRDSLDAPSARSRSPRVNSEVARYPRGDTSQGHSTPPLDTTWSKPQERTLPRGNGQVERYNRTLLDSLSTMGADLDDDMWDDNVANIQLGLNGTINKALGAAPSEVLMGYRVTGQVAFLPPDVTDEVDVSELRKRVCEKYPVYQARQKEQFDAKRSAPKQFQVGDLVLLRITSNKCTGTSQKLLPKWRGPFRIAAILGNDRYEVREIPGMMRSQTPYLGVAGIDNMKPWIQF